MQVAATTITTVLLGLAKEFSASSAQTSATTGEHYAFDNKGKNFYVEYGHLSKVKSKLIKNKSSAPLYTFKNPATYGRRFLVQL